MQKGVYCTPETSCMKGTSVHINNMHIKQLWSHKVWDFATAFRLRRLLGTVEKRATGPNHSARMEPGPLWWKASAFTSTSLGIPPFCVHWLTANSILRPRAVSFYLFSSFCVLCPFLPGEFRKWNNKVRWSVEWFYFQHRRNPLSVYHTIFSNSDNQIGKLVHLLKYLN